MSFPTGQHFIPKMLQKRFADAAGMLWVYDRRWPERGYFRSAPAGIFKERHLYTVTGPDGAPSDLVERTLGAVENAADPVIDRIVKHVHAGGGWDLTEDERAILLLFLHVQLKRCPEFFRGLSFDAPMRDLAEQSIATWEGIHGAIQPEERERHLSPSSLADFERSARMGALMSLSPTIVEALDARGLSIARITRPDRRFILASYPVVRLMSRSGRRDLGDPDVELWLPIAPDVAIGSYGVRHLNQVIGIAHDASIRKVNGELAHLSNTIASSSRDLLRSLVRRLPPRS
ncbi:MULTISPECIES: DUF4238 domain-containing protein [unclassified Methylobacterium]|uniref:DUF4238 domain-containing protein n=1 Tax=unclassified Methylobacterium TaxID=2615210 RepID=UPI0011C95772|nr:MULTISPECIES: DUF4238 domain-containing protein [unclassified Methylobacterium]MCJ2009851.1 DUF4238 domain-containing protein [Methylobacterium sp. J-092]TXN72826.1 DUF4238 domain-containing protein [Methylobacterium sp. WL6]